jgi:hypothetical protein
MTWADGVRLGWRSAAHLRLRNAEIFGDRDYLIKKVRAGWREAKDGKNRIIGTSA